MIMDKHRLPDTPWHIGFVKKDESDQRRHKSRCVHIKNGKCTYGKSNNYKMKCSGSAHCMYYAETKRQSEKVYIDTRTAEEEYADTINERLFSGKGRLVDCEQCMLPVHDDLPVQKFSGVESIKIKQIQLPNDYYEWKSDPDELKRVMEYYATNKKLDKPIVVEIKDGSYYLCGNYMQYYVSVKNNKKWIRCTFDNNQKERRKGL